MPEVRDTQRALTVISVTSCRGDVSPSPDMIKALCEEVPGVGALRVDTDRGKIHILYDGTISAIEQIERALRTLGLSIRYPEERQSSYRCTHTVEHPA